MNVGIAGAGIIGRLLAWHLLEKGHQVTLFDKDPVDSGSAAAYTAAGMLTPYSEAETAEPRVFDLGIASLPLWPQLIKQLGADVHYRTGGTLVVTHRQDQGEFNRFSTTIHQKLNAMQGQFSLLERTGINELEPELSDHFHQALYMPEEAWLCCCCLMPALGDALMARKVAWHSNTEVTDVCAGEISVKARSGTRSYHFDHVVDCRGMGAKPQMDGLRGVRGELLWVRAPEVNIKRLVRLMHPRYRLYVVPRRDDLYLIGATQIESEDYREITVRSSLELLSAAYSLHSGFAEARIVDAKVNCRPALPDNQPKLFWQEGLLRVNGLFRHGYLMGPALAQESVALLEQGSNYRSSFSGLIDYDNVETVITGAA